jgi:hypothetical protein
MLLPILAAFGTPRDALAIPRVALAIPMVALVVPTRPVKLRPVSAIEFRPLAKRPIAARAVALHTISRVAVAIPGGAVAIPVARARKARAFVAAAITRAIETRLVETRPCAALVAVATLALLPRLGFAMRRPFAEILARAALRIGSLLAIALPRGVRLPVAEFPVLESSGRTGLAAVVVVALGSRRSVITIPPRRAIATRLEIALIIAPALVPVEPRRPRPVAVIAARCALVVAAAWRTVIAAAGIRALAALALAEFALGELLLRPPRLARSALATERAVAPPAGSVVFIVVAGHEGLV